MSSQTPEKFCGARCCGRNDAFSLQFPETFDPRKMKKRRKIDADFAATVKRYKKQKVACCTPKQPKRIQGHRSRSLKRRNVERRVEAEAPGGYSRERFVESRHRRDSRRFVESSEDETPRHRHMSKRADADPPARYELQSTDDDNEYESVSMPWQWTAAVDSPQPPDSKTAQPAEAAVQSSFSATQLSPLCDASTMRQVSMYLLWPLVLLYTSRCAMKFTQNLAMSAQQPSVIPLWFVPMFFLFCPISSSGV